VGGGLVNFNINRGNSMSEKDCNTGDYNTGNCNAGNCNTGNHNAGNRNAGNRNTGNRNTGYRNAGDYNTGNCNTGNCNTGDYNTGNHNTGFCNTGDYNAGNRNTGKHNTGNCNTGYRNTGDYNTGNHNTGFCNTGNRNTGYCNTGGYNTGNYNAGNYNTGSFCVGTPVAILFDLPVEGMDQATVNSLIPNIELPSPVVWVFEKDMTEYEKTTNQSYKTTGGFLRKQDATVQDLFPIAWSKLNIDVKKQFLSLPNFDADKFLKCTGVDVRLDVELYPKSKIELITTEEVQTVVIGGKTYKLVEVNS
jgi:hypothetical protein